MQGVIDVRARQVLQRMLINCVYPIALQVKFGIQDSFSSFAACIKSELMALPA